MKRKNNRRAAFTALPLLVLVGIAACGTDVEPDVRAVALGEPSVQRLQDDLLPLRSLNSIQYLSDDSFVALDQAGQVVFVAGGAVRRRIGVKGEGPCQLEKPLGIASD